MSAIHRDMFQPDGRSQRGASILTAIFVLVALSVVGMLMTKLTVLNTQTTLNEWFSGQALYAAEAGIDWGANYVSVNHAGTCLADYSANANEVVAGKSWFDVTVHCDSIDSLFLYEITAAGKAGGSSGSPSAQRTLVVQFTPKN